MILMYWRKLIGGISVWVNIYLFPDLLEWDSSQCLSNQRRNFSSPISPPPLMKTPQILKLVSSTTICALQKKLQHFTSKGCYEYKYNKDCKIL